MDLVADPTPEVEACCRFDGLLLHGTPLTPAVWDDVAAHLPGPVSCPEVTGPRQDEIARRLLDEVPGPLHIVGHSYGAQVALEVALAAPDRVTHLTMIAGRASPFPPFAEVAASLRRGDPVDVDAAMGRWFRPAEQAAGGPLVAYARRCLADADRAAWAAALDAIATFDRLDVAAGLDVGVTLVAAGRDPVSGPAAMRELAGRLPRAELHVLDAAAHMSPFLDPAALAGLITRGAPGRGRALDGHER